VINGLRGIELAMGQSQGSVYCSYQLLEDEGGNSPCLLIRVLAKARTLLQSPFTRKTFL
jgi:hypothetical protein